MPQLGWFGFIVSNSTRHRKDARKVVDACRSEGVVHENTMQVGARNGQDETNIQQAKVGMGEQRPLGSTRGEYRLQEYQESASKKDRGRERGGSGHDYRYKPRCPRECLVVISP